MSILRNIKKIYLNIGTYLATPHPYISKKKRSQSLLLNTTRMIQRLLILIILLFGRYEYFVASLTKKLGKLPLLICQDWVIPALAMKNA
ncbi:MAG: hypothetical protein C1943_15265 [Halochromatium sp.]|nr:hypothetical protein [Halochromatium sp.]